MWGGKALFVVVLGRFCLRNRFCGQYLCGVARGSHGCGIPGLSWEGDDKLPVKAESLLGGVGERLTGCDVLARGFGKVVIKITLRSRVT